MQVFQLFIKQDGVGTVGAYDARNVMSDNRRIELIYRAV